jgi:hypothetical protein
MILKRLRDDTRGAALVEFTVVLPFFVLLTFGLIQAGLLLWTQSGLQHGVELATRCASVNYSANQLGPPVNTVIGCFGVPPNAVTNDIIKQYAKDHSYGLVPSFDSFTVTLTTPPAGVCGTDYGYQVTASAPYDLLHYIFSATLTATSKFPINCS